MSQNRASYKHWNIGMVYQDHKRNTLAVLVGISDYKHKTGCYLDFRYIDSKRYIRQNAAKALSRFETTGQLHQDETFVVEYQNETKAQTMPAKNITSQIENYVEAVLSSPKTNKKSRTKSNVSQYETIVLERYANVIYIDFIKKCRIY